MEKNVTEYTNQGLKVAVGEVCQTIGWSSIGSTPLNVMSDLLRIYIRKLGETSQAHANLSGRTESNLVDALHAVNKMGVKMGDLSEYLNNFEIPPANILPMYPARSKDDLNCMKPGSREVLVRPVHVYEHLPPMYPEMETRSPSPLPSSLNEDAKQATMSTPNTSNRNGNSASSGAATPSGGASDPSKYPEEGGCSIREISSVLMTSTGFLSPCREGRMADSKTPHIIPDQVEEKQKSAKRQLDVTGAPSGKKDESSEKPPRHLRPIPGIVPVCAATGLPVNMKIKQEIIDDDIQQVKGSSSIPTPIPKIKLEPGTVPPPPALLPVSSAQHLLPSSSVSLPASTSLSSSTTTTPVGLISVKKLQTQESSRGHHFKQPDLNKSSDGGHLPTPQELDEILTTVIARGMEQCEKLGIPLTDRSPKQRQNIFQHQSTTAQLLKLAQQQIQQQHSTQPPQLLQLQSPVPPSSVGSLHTTVSSTPTSTSKTQGTGRLIPTGNEKILAAAEKRKQRRQQQAANKRALQSSSTTSGVDFGGPGGSELAPKSAKMPRIPKITDQDIKLPPPSALSLPSFNPGLLGANPLIPNMNLYGFGVAPNLIPGLTPLLLPTPGGSGLGPDDIVADDDELEEGEVSPPRSSPPPDITIKETKPNIQILDQELKEKTSTEKSSREARREKERELEREVEKERNRAAEKERREKAAEKEREKAEKEREKAEKERERELERERAEKEREKAEKAEKERAREEERLKAEKQKEMQQQAAAAAAKEKEERKSKEKAEKKEKPSSSGEKEKKKSKKEKKDKDKEKQKKKEKKEKKEKKKSKEKDKEKKEKKSGGARVFRPEDGGVPKLKIKPVTPLPPPISDSSASSSSGTPKLVFKNLNKDKDAVGDHDRPTRANHKEDKSSSSVASVTIATPGSSRINRRGKRNSGESVTPVTSKSIKKHSRDSARRPHHKTARTDSIDDDENNMSGIITETVGSYTDESGNKVWICPACGKQDDGSPMIGCDQCDDWYHWLCVGINSEPAENQDWFCTRCMAKKQGVYLDRKRRK